MAKIAGRKKRIIVTTAVLATIGGGAAFAYWSSMGTGVGSATAGSDSEFTITSTTTATGGPLSPGGPTHTINFTVANPGSGSQYLAAVDATVAKANGDAWVSGECSADDFAITGYTLTPGEVAAGGTVSGSVKIQMINRAANQDDCKGVTVPVHFAAS
jgi:hypothetical protein